jgi:hypothetical protein
MEGRKQMKKRFTITKREYKTIIQIGKRFIDFYKRCCDNVVLSSLQKRVVFFEILDMFSKFALGSYPIDADVPEIFEIKCLKIAYIGFVFSEALEGEKARQKTDDYIREQCKKIKSLTDDEIEIFIDFLKTRSWKFEEDEDVYAMCEYILSVSQRIETKRMIRIMEFLEAENAHSMIEKMENLLKEIPECLEQFKTLFDRAEESWKKLQEHKKLRQIEEDRKMAALLQVQDQGVTGLWEAIQALPDEEQERVQALPDEEQELPRRDLSPTGENPQKQLWRREEELREDWDWDYSGYTPDYDYTDFLL